jgi:TetR/AcrR family transcriptional repressor of nem operon
MRAYTEGVRGKLAKFEAGTTEAHGRLRAFVGGFVTLLREGGRVCICVPLGAEYETLPGRVKRALRECIGVMEAWLTKVIEEGVKRGELSLVASAQETALAFLATVDGAMVAAKVMGDEGRLERAGEAAIEAMRGR